MKNSLSSLMFLLIFSLIVGFIIISLSQVAINTSYDYQQSLASQGSIQVSEGLEVAPLTLDWGTLEPGQNKSLPVTLSNVSPSNVDLTVQVSNWNPEDAKDYLTLESNAPATLSAKDSRQIDFTLTVDPLVSGIENFSFVISITGTV